MTTESIETLRQKAQGALQAYANAVTAAQEQPVSDIKLLVVTELGNKYSQIIIEGVETRLPTVWRHP